MNDPRVLAASQLCHTPQLPFSPNDQQRLLREEAANIKAISKVYNSVGDSTLRGECGFSRNDLLSPTSQRVLMGEKGLAASRKASE
eukprot:3618508-Prymnesium_polylepis.1